MAGPGAQRPVVHLPGVLKGFRPGLVAQVVGKLRPLGAGHQVEHRVVAGQHLVLRLPGDAGKHLPEFVVGDIGLVVHQGPVVQDQDVLLLDHLGRLQGQLFLVDLVGHHEILERQHRHAAAEGTDAEAGNQLRRRFRDGDDPPAVLLPELVQDAADQGGLARRGAAGQYDPGDFLFHGTNLISRSVRQTDKLSVPLWS